MPTGGPVGPSAETAVVYAWPTAASGNAPAGVENVTAMGVELAQLVKPMVAASAINAKLATIKRLPFTLFILSPSAHLCPLAWLLH